MLLTSCRFPHIAVLASDRRHDALILAALDQAGVGCDLLRPPWRRGHLLRLVWADVVIRIGGQWSPGLVRLAILARLVSTTIYWIGSGGRIADRYPVFSVHQLEMEPTALFWLSRIAKEDFSVWIRRGERWVVHNESGESLVDWRAGVIWRSVRRRGAGRPLVSRALRRLAWHGRGDVAEFRPGKEINREHRPYEYGGFLASLAHNDRAEDWLP